jgi:hypothetical protein
MEAHPRLVQVYNGAVEVCLGSVEAHPGALELKTLPGALEFHSGASRGSSWGRGGWRLKV